MNNFYLIIMLIFVLCFIICLLQNGVPGGVPIIRCYPASTVLFPVSQSQIVIFHLQMVCLPSIQYLWIIFMRGGLLVCFSVPNALELSESMDDSFQTGI